MTVNWTVYANDTSGNQASQSDAFTVLNRVPVFNGTIQDMAWSEDALKGMDRFLSRVFMNFTQNVGEASDDGVASAIAKMVVKVASDLDAFHFNTAIAFLMETLNEIEGKAIGTGDARKYIQMLAPFAPYLSEELWESLGGEGSVHASKWPDVDESALAEDTIEIPVQINGKVRGRVEVPADASEDSVREAVMALESIKPYIEGKDIQKFIYVPQRIATIVV